MNVREATPADQDAVLELFRSMDWDRPWPRPEIGPAHLEGKLVLVAEDDGEVVGFAFGEPTQHGRAHLNIACVREDRRRQGIARALVAEFAARALGAGSEYVTLDVDVTNEVGRRAWERLGGGESRVNGPLNGWVVVYSELADRDRQARERLASELSNATGAVVCTLAVEDGQVVRFVLYERGSVVDEYQSVPEYWGPLPPGDVIALAANPTVVARLTGADRVSVRAVARTASSPDDLPPAPELLLQIAEVMGLQGAGRG